MVQTKLIFEKLPTCDALHTSPRRASGGGEVSGLSKGHISTGDPILPKCTVFPGASFLKVTLPKVGTEPEDKPNFRRRGRVGVFSARSRRRLLQTFGKTLRDTRPAMVTLTYPNEWAEDPRIWKAHLNHFFVKMRRAWPKVAGVWKLEFQRRGAPHFHLILWGCPPRSRQSAYVVFRDWISRAWFEVVGSGDQKHLLAGCQFDEVESSRGAISYACKYVAKDELPDNVATKHNGRWWGIYRRAVLPFAQEFVIELQKHEAQFLLRQMRRQASRPVQNKKGRWRRRRVKASNGFVFLCDASGWARRLQELCALASASFVPEEQQPF